MTTTKTRVVYARVPHEVADALSADAEEFGIPPSTHLRRLLEGRYGASSVARKARINTRKTDTEDDTYMPEEGE